MIKTFFLLETGTVLLQDSGQLRASLSFPNAKDVHRDGVFIHLFVQCFNLTEIQDQQEHCTPGYCYMLEHRVLHFRQHLTPFYGVLHCFYKV